MILLSELNSILQKPITTDKNSSLSHVISELLKHNISRLIVADENSPVGIITEKDIGLFLLNDDTEKNLDDFPAGPFLQSFCQGRFPRSDVSRDRYEIAIHDGPSAIAK